jgi:hypothetical protein
MWRSASLWAVGAGLATFMLSTPAAKCDEMPARVRGTLEQVNGNVLSVKTRNGTSTTVPLKDGAGVVAVAKGAMSDIHSNTFVGITALAQPDGTIKAVEVHVFPESMRGTGEGHYAWDLMPNSTMTNAAVAQQVQKVDGNVLTLKYKDGEKAILVPTDAVVVNLIPSDKTDLKPGAKIFIPRWAKKADGTWEASVVLVGRDGITPPM